MNKIKVLLVNCPNRLSREPEFYPYGLALLTSVLEKHDGYVEIYDLNLYREQNYFFEYLRNYSNWDIIGVSGLITTYNYQVQLAEKIKQYAKESLLISGGGLASAVPELLLASSAFDIAIIGEGERIICDIINNINTRDFNSVDGIAWKREDNLIVLNKAADPIINLDSIPFPDWEKAHLNEYFKFSGFKYKGILANKFQRRADLTTTRGCPYHCSFCFNVFCRSEIRMRSVENVIEEIEMLVKKYNVDSIDFLDENFCFSRERVVEICNNLINKKINVKWGTAARVDNVDKELLLLMKEAGCVFLLYGFETGSQFILEKMNKRITIEQSWEAFKMTEDVGIDARGNLIIGHPGETSETLMESLDFQKKRYCYLMEKYKNYTNQNEFLDDMKKRFSTVSLCTPYPGTQIFQENMDKIGDVKDFLINISMNDAKKFVVNLSDISTDELLSYQKILGSPEIWFE